MFTAFSLVGSPPSGAPARAALTAAGVRLTDDESHAFVEPATITELAAAAGVSDGWAAGFEKMAEFARSKGWCDDGGRIRAHTEWDPAS